MASSNGVSAYGTTRARDAYRPIVERMKPACTDPELDLRCSILLLRDIASGALRNCSDEAHDINCVIVRLGSHYGLSSMNLETLQHLREVLGRLTLNATAIDNFIQQYWRAPDPDADR